MSEECVSTKSVQSFRVEYKKYPLCRDEAVIVGKNLIDALKVFSDYELLNIKRIERLPDALVIDHDRED